MRADLGIADARNRRVGSGQGAGLYANDIDSRVAHLHAMQMLEAADIALAHAPHLTFDGAFTLEGVTADWVQSVLAKDLPGVRLLSLGAGAGHSGMTKRGKYSLVWNEAGQAAGLPTAFFAKATPDDAYHRETLALMHMGDNEVSFYNQIQPTIPGVSPKAYYGKSHPGGRYILLTEDLDELGTTPHWMADHCSIGHAKAVAKAMAEYHALYWQTHRFETDLAWVRPRARRYGRFWHNRSYSVARKAFVDTPFAEGMDASLLKLLAAYEENFGRVLEHWDSRPVTLVHGDSHMGNTYSTPDGHAGLFDWQLVFRGSGFRDLAYFVYSALTLQDRLSHEREIFDHYLGELAKRGVPVDPEEGWRDYRLLILERWDSLVKSSTHGFYGHAPSAYLRQAESIHAGLLEHDVPRLLAAVLS